MSKQLKEIQQALQHKSDPKLIEFVKRVAPGTEKVYGVKTPYLNELAARYKSYSFSLAEELWASGFMEERIIAIKILEKTGKTDPVRLLKLFQQFLKGIDSWAVCDGLGMQFLSGIRKTHADKIFALAQKYNRSKNFWQRRLSLVMVEWYTRMKEYHPEIRRLVKNLEADEEYYVKKAVDWIKQNFAKGK
ncbi:MAG: DNA alkylation repair protein [Bacteroidota bacterium]